MHSPLAGSNPPSPHHNPALPSRSRGCLYCSEAGAFGAKGRNVLVLWGLFVVLVVDNEH